MAQLGAERKISQGTARVGNMDKVIPRATAGKAAMARAMAKARLGLHTRARVMEATKAMEGQALATTRPTAPTGVRQDMGRVREDTDMALDTAKVMVIMGAAMTEVCSRTWLLRPSSCLHNRSTTEMFLAPSLEVACTAGRAGRATMPTPATHQARSRSLWVANLIGSVVASAADPKDQPPKPRDKVLPSKLHCPVRLRRWRCLAQFPSFVDLL
mmetsp:Transcript_37905/g.70696  ORF Transcript_37905/g.70696 Transcript_37905/m.70696 type:complete len:214 (+) Transcript_37905:376-1017(+)